MKRACEALLANACVKRKWPGIYWSAFHYVRSIEFDITRNWEKITIAFRVTLKMRPLSPIVMHSKLCYVDGSPLRVFRSEMTEVPPDWLVGGWLQELFRSKSIYWLIFQEKSACLICKCRATSVISSLPALSVWHQNWWNSLAIAVTFLSPSS